MKKIFLLIPFLIVLQKLHAINDEVICTAVESFYAINITDSTADIGFDPNDALNYTIYYRKFETTTWLASLTPDSLSSLVALDACSGYEYYIVSNCPDGPLQSFTDTFFTTCDTATTGILNQLSYENKVFVYPNPSADMINISFEEPVHGSIELQLYNDRGELIDIKIINAYGATQLENIFFNVD
ncbi:MAG: hypothetical protein H7Y00_07395, partial [Fimbriimonadaceae bacterium]|nr:hypothetical protein [Chitinophagales bacterium]